MTAPAREAGPQAVETQFQPAAPGTVAGVVELLEMSTPEAVLGLQRTAGNQAVTRLIQREPDPSALHAGRRR
jgi:hypothetical protein